MGKSKQDSKPADKGPGGKGGKAKSKGDEAKDNKSSKGAQSINVRHILVSAHICLIHVTHGRIGVPSADIYCSVRSTQRRRKPSPSYGTVPSSMMLLGNTPRTRHGKV